MSANRNIFLAVFSALCLSSCAVSDKPVAQHPSSTNACSSLLAFSTSENNVVIKSAQIIPAGPVPPVMYQRPYAGTLDSYCRVDGAIDERIGANGKAYAIGFALALPEKWNGRFMMQGGGGLNGSVATPLGTNAAGDMTALQRVLRW
jgi:hypothetical protein